MSFLSEIELPGTAKYFALKEQGDPYNSNYDIVWSFKYAMSSNNKDSQYGIRTFLTTLTGAQPGINPGHYLCNTQRNSAVQVPISILSGDSIKTINPLSIISISFDSTGFYALSTATRSGFSRNNLQRNSLIIRDIADNVIFNKPLSSITTEFDFISSEQIIRCIFSNSRKKIFVDYRNNSNSNFTRLADVDLNYSLINENNTDRIFTGLSFCSPISSKTQAPRAMKLYNIAHEGVKNNTVVETITANELAYAYIEFFRTDNTTIFTYKEPQKAALQWNVVGANRVVLDNNIGSVVNRGSYIVEPSQTTTYTLCATKGLDTLLRALTVNVVGTPLLKGVFYPRVILTNPFTQNTKAFNLTSAPVAFFHSLSDIGPVNNLTLYFESLESTSNTLQLNSSTGPILSTSNNIIEVSMRDININALYPGTSTFHLTSISDYYPVRRTTTFSTTLSFVDQDRPVVYELYANPARVNTSGTGENVTITVAYSPTITGLTVTDENNKLSASHYWALTEGTTYQDLINGNYDLVNSFITKLIYIPNVQNERTFTCRFSSYNNFTLSKTIIISAYTS